jgi:hypothetical protein
MMHGQKNIKTRWLCSHLSSTGIQLFYSRTEKTAHPFPLFSQTSPSSNVEKKETAQAFSCSFKKIENFLGGRLLNIHRFLCVKILSSTLYPVIS